MLGKKSSNITLKNNKTSGTSSPKQFKTPSSKRDVETSKSSTFQKEKSFRCIKCEGYGRFQVECPSFLKKQNKSYGLTLSDDESKDTSESKEDVKTLVNNISSDALLGEISKYDMFLDNNNDPVQHVAR